MRLLPCALLTGLLSMPLFAAPLNGFSFAHKDWEVACDNTGTCRAAGYSDNAVSVLLKRPAGPDTSVTVEVAFAQRMENQPPLTDAALFIDGQKEGALTPSAEGYFTLSYALRSAFLTALRQDNTIEFAADGNRIPLSSAGSNAVLLKMDEFQKRLSTQSALLHPGDKNSNDVLQAEPAPLIITQPVIRTPEVEPLTATQRLKMAHQLRLTPEMGCREPAEGQERLYYRIPVDKQHTLIQTECFDASRFALWLTNAELTSPPVLITSDASEYENGEIARFSGPVQFWVWNGKHFILRDEYHSGGQGTLSVGGVWTLPTFVSNVRAQSDVDADNAALKALYDAITEQQKIDPELDLSKIAKRFPLTGQFTDFTLSYTEDSSQPTTKPSPEISDDEWRAFLHSNIRAYAENGQVNFTLVDLDGDGKRDLIIDSYIGGTGLFSYTGVLKRGDGAFLTVNENANDDDVGVPGALFSENGRGANQWSQWVRINGQVYALWFNGVFGEDNIYLLRPFSTDNKVPVVTLRYHYTLDVIDSAEEGRPLTPALSDKDKAGLFRALDVMQDHLLKDLPPDQPDTAICPVPEGISAEDAEWYYSGLAGHYTIETVALVPVWLNEKCYIGTVFSHHGFYDHGVDAEVVLSSPAEKGDIVGGYAISGLRQATSIKSDWQFREGDNGAL
ncbi:DUF1176 domain-containing protein [Citrobacter rodentium]|uniref:Exported protein n=2 Tax=Citrobacter rodentium TaxID=67825 RepID=D2TM94_CITRI|nr:DUF1176 domain-containing protein [Citrobacter rodentium]KIQ50995.1 hypothetical protein TA05_12585 [Citrobacter rodentium]QBY29601.1 DUF1176 domain-containing protein [Citrobacter rodentium]UHO33005.1 DUF1176 domain-containing protein [Citrobacter rodentium NBRC 105723 = DSM 16636]CBG89917.1 putative exported protein [Citrobacter rodentium ICC168]HAT8014455.1 DUF1176 domain-containing protein [Citrobacter rodentium NBRC 105723 = DSM 16636]